MSAVGCAHCRTAHQDTTLVGCETTKGPMTIEVTSPITIYMRRRTGRTMLMILNRICDAGPPGLVAPWSRAIPGLGGGPRFLQAAALHPCHVAALSARCTPHACRPVADGAAGGSGWCCTGFHQSGYFTDIALFRCIKGFLCQFGIAATPELNQQWRARGAIKDDPHVLKTSSARMKKGMISFAGGGIDSRTTQLFVNLRDRSVSWSSMHVTSRLQIPVALVFDR